MDKEFKYSSLGIHGVAGKIDIPGTAVVVEQYARPDGKHQLDIAMTNLDDLPIEEGAVLEVVVKDNSIAYRREFAIGAWSQIDRTRVEIPLDRELKPSRTQIYLHIFDPKTAKLWAATEELRLRDDGPAGPQGAAGSSASFIKFKVDPDQELPVRVIVDKTEPAISFGTMGPASVLESRSDFAFVGYALPLAIEKLVVAALLDRDDSLCSDQWLVLKDRVADLAGYADWGDMKSRVTEPADILSNAQDCAAEFMARGRLKHTLAHLHKIARSTAEELR